MSFLCATAAAGSSSSYTLATSHLIEDRLMDLRSCKKDEFGKTLSKVQSLIGVLLAAEGLSGLTAETSKFIGMKFKTVIESNISLTAKEQLSHIFFQAANLKNALQMEAVIFGGLYPTINRYHRLLSEPKLEGLVTQIPKIFKCINLNSIFSGIFEIEIEPLAEYFNSQGYSNAWSLFDHLMFRFAASGALSDDGLKILIPVQCLPPKEFIEVCLESADPRCRVLAQIFAIFFVESESLDETNTPFPLNLRFLELLDHDNLHGYLEKQPLIPFLARAISLQESMKASGLESKDIIIHPDFIFDLHRICGKSWLEQSAETFDLVRKIDLYVRKIFDKSELVIIDHRIETEGCDPMLIIWSNLVRSLNAEPKFLIPIDAAHPFCTTKEDYLLLPFFKSFQAHMKHFKDEAELMEKAELKALKASVKKKKKPALKPAATGGAGTASTCAAMAGASASAEAVYTEEEIDYKALETILPEKFLASLRHPKSAASSAPASAHSSDPIAVSIEATRHFLKDARFEKRVSDWWVSKEMGLSHRALDSTASDYLAQKAQLELTHDLPKELLLFACNPLYSTPGVYGDPGMMRYNHFTSCIFIDEKKYKLTVAFNRVKSCYHFSAKEILSFETYLNLKAPGEFPTLAEALSGASEEVVMADSAFSIDGLGNAIFPHKSHVIKIIKMN